MKECLKFGNLEVSNIGMGCMGFSHGYGKAAERFRNMAVLATKFHLDTSEVREN